MVSLPAKMDCQLQTTKRGGDAAIVSHMGQSIQQQVSNLIERRNSREPNSAPAACSVAWWRSGADVPCCTSARGYIEFGYALRGHEKSACEVWPVEMTESKRARAPPKEDDALFIELTRSYDFQEVRHGVAGRAKRDLYSRMQIAEAVLGAEQGA